MSPPVDHTESVADDVIHGICLSRVGRRPALAPSVVSSLSRSSDDELPLDDSDEEEEEKEEEEEEEEEEGEEDSK